MSEMKKTSGSIPKVLEYVPSSQIFKGLPQVWKNFLCAWGEEQEKFRGSWTKSKLLVPATEVGETIYDLCSDEGFDAEDLPLDAPKAIKDIKTALDRADELKNTYVDLTS